MPLSNILPDIYVPTFTLKVDDKPLPPQLAASVLEVSVTEHLSPPNEFTFRVNDPTLKSIDPRQQGIFTEGTRVEVAIGYQGHTTVMIVGQITAVAADFSSGPVAIELEGYDLLHSATRGTTLRVFGGPGPDTAFSDSEVVSQIAADLKLDASVDPTPPRTEAWVQNNITDIEMLEAVARASGYFLWMDGKTLYFKATPPVPTRVPLTWGQNLLSFSSRISTAGRVGAFEVRAWDYGQKQPITGRAERSAGSLSPAGEQQVATGAGGKSERVIWRKHGIRSAKEAKAFAERLMSDQEQDGLSGSGTSVGRTDIRAGSILDLSNLGRFNGSYQVDSTTHTVGEGGYQTSFQVRRVL